MYEMNLTRVLTGCWGKYSECLPAFVQTWRKLYPAVETKVVLISDTLPAELAPWREHVILFPPVEGIPCPFISQYIRLLYPAVLDDRGGGIMVTDIDLMPMNRHYFRESIRDVSDDAFVSYWGAHAWALNGQINVAYNVARAKTWGEIFHIQNVRDIIDKLISVDGKYRKVGSYREGKGDWFSDQKELYKDVKAWNAKTDRHVRLPRRIDLFRIGRRKRRTRAGIRSYLIFVLTYWNSVEREMNPIHFLFVLLCVRLEIFFDYHVLRFHEACWEMNDKILQSIPSDPLPRWAVWSRTPLLFALRGIRFTHFLIAGKRYLKP